MDALLKLSMRWLRWPFENRLASPLWFLVRLYLGSVWIRFGWSKMTSGWFQSNPVRPLLEAVASGQMQLPVQRYAQVAEWLLRVGADEVLSTVIPVAEVLVGVAFVSGTLLIPAAVGAVMMNLNFVLSGVASLEFDGRLILFQSLLLLAWKVADYLGLWTLIRRWHGGMAPLHPLLR